VVLRATNVFLHGLVVALFSMLAHKILGKRHRRSHRSSRAGGSSSSSSSSSDKKIDSSTEEEVAKEEVEGNDGVALLASMLFAVHPVHRLLSEGCCWHSLLLLLQ